MTGPRNRLPVRPGRVIHLVFAAAVLGACANTGSTRSATQPGDTAAQGRYATVNGLPMYYEIHGRSPDQQRPLVLLHGGGSTITTTFGRVLPLLASSRQIIAIELQGHGHTADRPAPLSFEQDADDVAALLAHLGVTQADVFGFSNGANTTLQLARRHPTLTHRLIVASGFVTKDGIPDSLWAFFRLPPDPAKMPPALRQAYLQSAPDTTRLPALAGKLMARLNGFHDWTDDEIRAIRAPTLVMIGDADAIRPEHAVRMARLLPHAQLAIFPGAEHGAYIGELSAMHACEECIPAAVQLITRFLDAP